jgi:hypothetical protein
LLGGHCRRARSGKHQCSDDETPLHVGNVTPPRLNGK